MGGRGRNRRHDKRPQPPSRQSVLPPTSRLDCGLTERDERADAKAS